MLFWIVPFLFIHFTIATTKVPTIYIEVVDSKKLANLGSEPLTFLPLKRQVKNMYDSALHKSDDHLDYKSNLQIMVSKNKELDMQLDNQENRKREKVGKRLLLATCLREGKSELQVMHELMRARQLRMNHTISQVDEGHEDLSKADEIEVVGVNDSPQAYTDQATQNGFNVVDIESPQIALQIPAPMLNLPMQEYLANKPRYLPDYSMPKFYWPSPDLRALQMSDTGPRLYKRYENLTKHYGDNSFIDPFRTNGRIFPYRNSLPYIPAINIPN